MSEVVRVAHIIPQTLYIVTITCIANIHILLTHTSTVNLEICAETATTYRYFMCNIT